MTILEEIVEVKKEEVNKLHKEYSFSRFNDSEFFDKDKFDFYDKVYNDNNISVIAEIKKASPSKGIIRNNFDHLKIADIYMNSGADAISVLTDVNFFKGSVNYLKDIASIKSVPLLRKDFIIDEFQVYEAKANGADIILLISEILSKNQIEELTHAACENKMEVLLELHSQDQFEKINFGLNNIIGINNRDLHTFKVDIDKSVNLSGLMRDGTLVVAESGFKNKEDIDKIKDTNVKALLAGERFMSSTNISDEVKRFKEWCRYEG